MSVNILRLRCTIEAQPRSKKGHPPHNTTGVANASSIHPNNPPWRRPCSGWAGNTSEIMMASRGRVSTAPTHRRRVMLTSSGLAALAVTVRGSSAMPQIGQAPGWSRTICGCMGQVYSVCSDGEEGWVGSSAIPHFGQAPGFPASTSGCMGQVYSPDAAGDTDEVGAEPMDTRGSACEPSYLCGSASNFVLQL